jgi:hypothetical protein
MTLFQVSTHAGIYGLFDHLVGAVSRRSRIARCEVRYNREKVLLVETGHNLDH